MRGRLKNCFELFFKKNGYSEQSEKVEGVLTKNKNNLKEKLW